MITSSNTMALNNHCATALGPRLGLGLRLDFGSQVWFVQYFSENLVVVLYAKAEEAETVPHMSLASVFTSAVQVRREIHADPGVALAVETAPAASVARAVPAQERSVAVRHVHIVLSARECFGITASGIR